MILPCKTVSFIMDFVEVGIVNVEMVVTRIVTWDIFFAPCHTSDIVLDVIFSHTSRLN
jgi:hypothetical protein